MISSGADVIIIEIKCTINVKHLNHPKSIPLQSQSVEKLSSTKPVPGAEKVGDRCSRRSHLILRRGLRAPGGSGKAQGVQVEPLDGGEATLRWFGST